MPGFDVSWLAIIVATLAYFALGAVWYMALSGQWMAAVGKDREQIESDQRSYIYAVQFVATALLTVLVAYLVVNVFSVASIAEGLLAGALIGGVAILASSGDFLYEGRSLRLFLINSGYRLVGIMLMSAIVAWLG